jgi:nicotinamide-nucleotide amidase
MTIAILATGDEIIHGDTLNTNSHALAHTLSSEGLPLGLQLACSDKEADIIDCLTFLAHKHDIIIVIGGLGPTTDDLTRFALAQFTNEPLVQHQEALTHIQNRLNNAQVSINAGNLQQCLFPKDAHLLPNPNGTAVGCYYNWNNKMLFLLPGPPHECLPMFHQHIIPLLQRTQRSKKQILKWRIFGLAESEIAQTLENALSSFDCQTGYRLDVPYVEFKVRCTQNLVEEIKQVIDPLLAPHIIASIDKKASDKLREFILNINHPITIIDEATGGLLETLLVRPGVHHLLNFNTLDRTKLFFHIRGLDEYWSQQGPNGTTQLSIHYSDPNHEGGETHTIPYRSPLVVHHAVEWLSFRLFHLINQLH